MPTSLLRYSPRRLTCNFVRDNEKSDGLHDVAWNRMEACEQAVLLWGSACLLMSGVGAVRANAEFQQA